MKIQRDIYISTSHEKIKKFLLKAENLPIWTRFFQKKLGFRKDCCIMQTPLGQCLTRCEESQNGSSTEIKIISQFDNKVEVANISLKELVNQSHLIFHLTTPENMDQKVRDKMLKNLEEELIFLKDHMELV